jgi:hypothetical protein
VVELGAFLQENPEYAQGGVSLSTVDEASDEESEEEDISNSYIGSSFS